MAVFQRMQKEFIERNFKYTALAFGFIPVYISDPTRGNFHATVRNWIPEWPLDVMNFLYNRFLELADPFSLTDAPYPFTITGKIK